MKAVILAAGLGTRLDPLTKEVPKGLLKVAGREILYRTMKALEELGIEEFIVITNPKYKSKFEEFLNRDGFKHKIILNKSPEKGNGYSLYLAKNYISDKFVLVMGDHIYEKAFFERALKCEGLIIDKIGAFIDRKEATKVLYENKRIKDIGKHLERWNGFDTGFFVLTPEIFNYAEEIIKEKAKAELSEIVKRARLKVSEVSGCFWMDIDTPSELKRARREIIRNSIKGAGDGLISRTINRKISTRISEVLIGYVIPNQMTVITFFLGIISALVALFNIPLAGTLYQVSSILDGVDGEIARASMRMSKFGGWIDSILDRYVDFAFLLALAFSTGPGLKLWVIIALAIFGSVMVSYSTERYRAAYSKDMYKEIPIMRYLIGKRDERIFLTMVFCLINRIPELFALLAVITNLRIVLTVWLAWKHDKNI